MEDIIINSHITIPASAVKFKFTRSSGKGGQNVNKVSTKVELFFAVDMIQSHERIKHHIRNKLANKLDSENILRIVSQESRSQWQNKQSAIERLILIISDAAKVERERIATKPTRSSKNQRVEKKKKEGQRKLLRHKSFGINDD